MKPEKRMSYPELRITDDGSHTLYVPDLDEHYHSHYGALTESLHIFINAGLDFCTCNPVKIFETGFGTGLNALLSAMYAEENMKKVIYSTVEKYPLPESIVKELNYGSLLTPEASDLFDMIHLSPWDKQVVISDFFTIEKIKADFITDTFSGIYDLIYFDAFGPDKQPEMWSDSVFTKIAMISSPGTVFVTYSAKGVLKRMLKNKEFDVEQLPGPPGKRCITRAVKK